MNCIFRVVSIYNMDPHLIFESNAFRIFSKYIFAKKLSSKLTENSFSKNQNKLLEADVKGNEPVWIYFNVYQ